jgi:hypothetical protein
MPQPSTTPTTPNPDKKTTSIFLHTGWRSAGTWVWSRFRALPSVAAFYEPLHPLLGELTLPDIPALQPTWTSGHPPLNAPYYEEYRPFIPESARGVVGYRASFATDRFSTEPDAGFPALHAYLNHLRNQTIARGKVPVFKFCRSSGRLPWLRSAFPDALHAVVLRNPASQFASGWLLQQQWSNPFFVAAPFRVLGLNQAEPVVRQVIEVCGVRLPPDPPTSPEAYAAACERYAQTVEGGNAYRAFLALWILCAARMADAMDLVIDMDRIGQSPAHAAELRAQLRSRTDATPSFHGARDLVEETRRSAAQMRGIDGRSMRAVHFAAQRFMPSQARTDAVELVREKLALADELSDGWRF